MKWDNEVVITRLFFIIRLFKTQPAADFIVLEKKMVFASLFYRYYLLLMFISKQMVNTDIKVTAADHSAF